MFGARRTEQRTTFYSVISLGGFGLLCVLAALVLQLQRPTVVELTPSMTGETERCLTCHNGIESISASHSTEEFGCVSCHGGNALAIDEAAAHSEMVVNPSAPEYAQQYCGSCHAAQVLTVERSIMTTYSGAISLIRRAYGLQETEVAEYASSAVGHLQAFVPEPDDPQHVHDFAANCLSCHTSAEAEDADYFYRSTGCATCHVLYDDDGLYEGGDPTISRTEAGHGETHSFTTAIPYTQCNHCHNRGNYDLRTMTFVPRSDMPPDPELSGDALRLHDYYQPIGQYTQCEFDLDCIDCHTSQEVMGDGLLYNNRSEAAYVECRTCHGTLDELPLESVVTSNEDLAMTRANLNPLVELEVGDTIMMTERNEALYHIRRVGDEWIVTGKATGERYVVPMVQGSTCTQDVENQSSTSCHQCHNVEREQTP